jgi:glycine/D-amino acid oxidase-like deaminating enzyme/nitrite reductase/ring-hydroxylating ferredoxin subunit
VEPANRSLWIETTPETSYPTLDDDLTVDVAVIGAGITGVAAAWLLKNAGLRVALVEMNRVGSGTTGYTTAKLTVGHSLIYADLERTHGQGTARVYAESNQWALAQLRELVAESGIDCDWEPAANYVYTTKKETRAAVESEADAARRAGLAAELTTETALPFPVVAAVRVDDQAQFHPRKFVQGLAERIAGDDSYVFEQTRATDVRRGEVITARGVARATHVVVATHMPFLDRSLLFAKAHPQKSYAIAAPAAQAPAGMYISADEPTRSIRSAPGTDASRVLIVGGEGHKPGRDDDTRRRYGALEEFLREHFEAGEIAHRWSTHDYVPVDKLPYIGRLRRRDRRVFSATGFAKWGLTKGFLAAAIIADEILGRKNPWAATYNANRLSPKAGIRRFATENGHVAAWFVGDRLRPRDGHDDLEDLGAGDGKVVRIGARHLAVHRNDDGVLEAVSARCTHLGCLVGWNRADRTWECPCHGSRFAADGSLIEGPASEPLPARTI